MVSSEWSLARSTGQFLFVCGDKPLTTWGRLKSLSQQSWYLRRCYRGCCLTLYLGVISPSSASLAAPEPLDRYNTCRRLPSIRLFVALWCALVSRLPSSLGMRRFSHHRCRLRDILQFFCFQKQKKVWTHLDRRPSPLHWHFVFFSVQKALDPTFFPLWTLLHDRLCLFSPSSYMSKLD